MKMDKNVDTNGSDSPPRYELSENQRQSAMETLDEILDIVSNGADLLIPPPPSNSVLTRMFRNVAIQPDDRTFLEINSVDGIDPLSPLGRSLQIKFTELKEISRRLKFRLNEVVCDEEITLSPDAESNINDMDLEWDLNTDSHAEDVTPQEFLQLVQMASTSQTSIESSDKSDDISK